jgi:2-methylcitrate dehydratase PrpD
VFGYSCTVFGAAAAFGKLRGHAREMLTADLGIAGAMSPVNTQWSWSMHTPTATVKYGIAGAVTQAAMAAAYLAELGHTGDIQVLDDGEHGYRRLIGSERWAPERITPGLGQDWYFPLEQSYKPYPHCRILHAPLDVLTRILEDNDIRPNEIESIKAWVEAWVMKPLWINRDVKHVTEAQFSIAHGLAVGAHRIPVGKAWQSPEVVFDPSVIALMDKVEYIDAPEYAGKLASNAAARPARIEVRARGKTFVGEAGFPKGSPSPDPTTTMTMTRSRQSSSATPKACSRRARSIRCWTIFGMSTRPHLSASSCPCWQASTDRENLHEKPQQNLRAIALRSAGGRSLHPPQPSRRAELVHDPAVRRSEGRLSASPTTRTWTSS